MLQSSTINPLDSPEARPYKDAPEIAVMTRLVAHFHDNEVAKFEEILNKNEGKVRRRVLPAAGGGRGRGGRGERGRGGEGEEGEGGASANPPVARARARPILRRARAPIRPSRPR
jgi:hypothetical protein